MSYWFDKYKEPKVYKKILSDEVCDYLINKTKNNLCASRTGGGVTMYRVSDSAFLHYDEDPIVKKIFEKLQSITGQDYRKYECLNVTRYLKGGYYKVHQDADLSTNKREENRIFTAIFYLNDNYEGGETVFPYLRKKYKLSKGDMLLFNSFNEAGFKTKYSIHGGDLITKGEKWISVVWGRK
jgi:prolyl 4-hydroxylase